MSELHLQHMVRDYMPNLNTIRIENKLCPGTPDIFFITDDRHTGWIELKYAKSWNKTVKFRRAQPIWMRAYHEMGGCTIILTLVDGGYIRMADGAGARQIESVKICNAPKFASFHTTTFQLNHIGVLIAEYAKRRFDKNMVDYKDFDCALSGFDDDDS